MLQQRLARTPQIHRGISPGMIPFVTRLQFGHAPGRAALADKLKLHEQ
jgi:hypothetical protein